MSGFTRNLSKLLKGINAKNDGWEGLRTLDPEEGGGGEEGGSYREQNWARRTELLASHDCS